MTITLMPATKADAQEITVVYSRAFHDDPLFCALCPNVVTRPAGLRHIFASEMVDALVHAEVLVARDGDRIVGVASWYRGDNLPTQPARVLRQGLRVAPALWALGKMAPKGMRLLADLEKKHPLDRPHYYLAALGVDPGWQSRGVGRMLTEGHIARSDEEGLGCFLETQTEANVSYYSRVGFEVTERFDAWSDGPPMWTMWREPRPPSEEGPE